MKVKPVPDFGFAVLWYERIDFAAILERKVNSTSPGLLSITAKISRFEVDEFAGVVVVKSESRREQIAKRQRRVRILLLTPHRSEVQILLESINQPCN